MYLHQELYWLALYLSFEERTSYTISDTLITYPISLQQSDTKLLVLLVRTSQLLDRRQKVPFLLLPSVVDLVSYKVTQKLIWIRQKSVARAKLLQSPIKTTPSNLMRVWAAWELGSSFVRRKNSQENTVQQASRRNQPQFEQTVLRHQRKSSSLFFRRT